MIRVVKPAEAEQVFELMHEVYADHSFLEQGFNEYLERLADGSYVSVGDFNRGKLLAHAGYSALTGFALMNALVVAPEHRSQGLGEKVFKARLSLITQDQSFNFVAGYSMMQHAKSQRLYPDTFKPIGIDIGYPDIYHQADSRFNQGQASNAEMVLCRRLSDRPVSIRITLRPHDFSLASDITNRVGVDCIPELSEPIDEDDKIFLGFHPDKTGLFVPAFISPEAGISFDPLVASSPERQEFLTTIRENYERNAKN